MLRCFLIVLCVPSVSRRRRRCCRHHMCVDYVWCVFLDRYICILCTHNTFHKLYLSIQYVKAYMNLTVTLKHHPPYNMRCIIFICFQLYDISSYSHFELPSGTVLFLNRFYTFPLGPQIPQIIKNSSSIHFWIIKCMADPHG